MWSTIANFKDNLTQIAADVLDSADEFKDDGPLDNYEELYDSQKTSHSSVHSSKESDLKSELQWYRSEVLRLQAEESETQSLCMKYVALLKDQEDDLLRLREENGLLKEKLSVTGSENGLEVHEDLREVEKLEETLKKLESKLQSSEEFHKKQVEELQHYHEKESKSLIAQYKQELAHADALCKANHMTIEKSPLLMSNGAVPNLVQDEHLQKLELEVLQLQQNEKELSIQLLEKEEVYGKLKTAYDRFLDEARWQKEELSKEKEVSLQKDAQLQRDHQAAQDALKECELFRVKNDEMSKRLSELLKTLNQQDATSGESTEEYQLAISNLQRKCGELEEERDKLRKALDQNTCVVQEELASESDEIAMAKESVVLKEATAEVDRLLGQIKASEEVYALQKLAFEQQLGQVVTERDKLTRDLGRLKQHLLDKELADSEKMDQDSEQIADLQARAEENLVRAVEADKALARAQNDLRELCQNSKEELSRVTSEIENLQQKLASCIAALESKDAELSNLQSALGQYYAESEAQDRCYLDLSAAREDCAMLSEQLQTLNHKYEAMSGERDVAVEKLTLTEQRTLETQLKIRKLEAEVLQLRRALEQSMSQLNSLSSDSDYHVDRRIVIKLLVTYFQRNHSKEVLDLMVRMLGFSDEDKRRVGLAQQAAGRGVVRGVLGLPGRFVGGLIGSASADSLTLPKPADNQSFADLWIDFLLKESEERVRREQSGASANPEIESGSSDRNFRISSEHAGYYSSSAKGSVSMPPSPSHFISHRPSSSFSGFSSGLSIPTDLGYKVDKPSQLPSSGNGEVLASGSRDPIVNDFSSIPLNSSATMNSGSSFGHPKPPLRP